MSFGDYNDVLLSTTEPGRAEGQLPPPGRQRGQTVSSASTPLFRRVGGMMPANTLEKTIIHVLSVRNVSHPELACITIWIFMQVNTNAQSAVGVVEIAVT